jgi:ubiquinone/menaquinone biosynthesis C-methylase UbiE
LTLPPVNHFNLLAHRYDRLFRRPIDDPLPRLVEAHEGDCILDAGGGTGRNALALKDAGAWMVVCDYSLGMLRYALERDLPAVLADVTHLPFAAGVFDRTLVVDALHHFVDPNPEVAQGLATGELLRTLKNGGRLVLEEPNLRRWQTRLIAAAERILLMRSRFLAPEILVSLMEGQGVQCLLREEHGFSVDLVFEKTGVGDGE